jgi:hypothetical protein
MQRHGRLQVLAREVHILSCSAIGQVTLCSTRSNIVQLSLLHFFGLPGCSRDAGSICLEQSGISTEMWQQELRAALLQVTVLHHPQMLQTQTPETARVPQPEFLSQPSTGCL